VNLEPSTAAAPQAHTKVLRGVCVCVHGESDSSLFPPFSPSVFAPSFSRAPPRLLVGEEPAVHVLSEPDMSNIYTWRSSHKTHLFSIPPPLIVSPGTLLSYLSLVLRFSPNGRHAEHHLL